MNQRNKLKIINDPIYGFITIPSPLIFDLIEHPYFQRLRRITQMGLSHLVYPGANHTRFHHALGCLHLMKKTLDILKSKGIEISDEEEEAVLIAILLHDIGHGPFSHALEHSIVSDLSHEYLSLEFMNKLNSEFNGQLDLAIDIFRGNHKKKFLCQLISSQLDIDRLDYLKRDSFYTGVAEGNINSERLINMLNVVDNELVVEEKGIYSIEKFLVARRLMYWQVYLHKTSLCAEQILIKLLRRAKLVFETTQESIENSTLNYFLRHKIDSENFDDITLELFSKLDDYDIISALKVWQYHEDFVLSKLSQMILNRDLLKIKLRNEPINPSKLEEYLKKVQQSFNISEAEANYFVFDGSTSNLAYQPDKEHINMWFKNGEIKDVSSASDQLNLKALSKTVIKYYICYPKSYN
ncbi:HD domain-containing protein [Psychroflexus sp. CAK57W]|uniref:HD domain-containing protein n=1 Tax=Psychroflexus curvus TaxID=2873595 RepID=UPI001CCFE3DB|nr:HD domain-containing protein [Psychroflexus curvus]MBZ9626777.1 HD domain-containing protein [Psychroflexus curvus]MBZ9786552.1 HD domain-containing protein [Psychroflexus curvus]